MNQEQRKKSKEGFKVTQGAKGHRGCYISLVPSTTSEGWSQEGKFGVQKGKRLSQWCIQSWPGVRGGKGWTRSWCWHPPCIDRCRVPGILLTLSSCKWNRAAPQGQSPEPCSSPVTFPNEEVLGLGTAAIWSPGQGHLSRAPGIQSCLLPNVSGDR